MEMSTLVTVLGGAVVLGLVVLAFYIRLKKNPSATDKQEAEKFLKGLEEVFYNKMIDIVNTTNFIEYHSFVALETDILNKIYDAIWEYTQKEMEEAAKSDILTAMAMKALDKKNVLAFVDRLISMTDVKDQINAKWSDSFKVKISSMESEDKELADKFADNTEYVENVDNVVLEPAQEEAPKPDEEVNIIPPTEEEKDYDPEKDETVEYVEE